MSLLKQDLRQLTTERLQNAFTLEHQVAQAVKSLDEFNIIINTLIERINSWYGMHFPELFDFVEEEKLAKIICLGNRENLSKSSLKKLTENDELTEKILLAAKDSVGSALDSESEKQLVMLAKNVLNVLKEKVSLEKFVEKQMTLLSPNFSSLAQPLIAARMLAHTGSLRRLTLMPSSTIQILGAEKALFKHLRKGSSPPKYGFLFQHSELKKLPLTQRGKFSRSLAAKISLALKEDFFGDKKIDKNLEKSLAERSEKLQSAKVKKESTFTEKEEKKENAFNEVEKRENKFKSQVRREGSGGYQGRRGSSGGSGGYQGRSGSSGGYQGRSGSSGGYQGRSGSSGGYQGRSGGSGRFRGGSDGSFKPRERSDNKFKDGEKREGASNYPRRREGGFDHPRRSGSGSGFPRRSGGGSSFSRGRDSGSSFPRRRDGAPSFPRKREGGFGSTFKDGEKKEGSFGFKGKRDGSFKFKGKKENRFKDGGKRENKFKDGGKRKSRFKDRGKRF
ncbi:MAG: NOP5/NOP56 family protein [archaeon]